LDPGGEILALAAVFEVSDVDRVVLARDLVGEHQVPVHAYRISTGVPELRHTHRKFP